MQFRTDLQDGEKKFANSLGLFLFCRPRCPRAGSILPRSYSTAQYCTLGNVPGTCLLPTGSAVFEQGTVGSPERARARAPCTQGIAKREAAIADTYRLLTELCQPGIYARREGKKTK